jgi:hypothetical protein
MHWPAITNTYDTPKLVGIPMTCPVIPSHPIHDGRELTQHLTLDKTRLSPVLAMWFNGMAYLLDHNASSSLHTTANIFVWNEIDLDTLDTCSLCININASIVGLNTISRHFQHVTNIFKEEKMAAIYRYASNNSIHTPGTVASASDPLV